MITIEPKSGNIGIIKAPHAVQTTGVTLFVPEIEPVYNTLKKMDTLISAALTGKFDYKWVYDQQAQAYLLMLNYYQGKVEFTIKFPRERAGQILQALIDQEQHVVTIVLKYKEGSNKLFDDAVVLMGIELDMLPEAGWPIKH